MLLVFGHVMLIWFQLWSVCVTMIGLDVTEKSWSKFCEIIQKQSDVSWKACNTIVNSLNLTTLSSSSYCCDYAMTCSKSSPVVYLQVVFQSFKRTANLKRLLWRSFWISHFHTSGPRRDLYSKWWTWSFSVWQNQNKSTFMIKISTGNEKISQNSLIFSREISSSQLHSLF